MFAFFRIEFLFSQRLRKHNFIYLERNVSNPIFACFLCWTKITFWPLLTLFWSNSKVTYDEMELFVFTWANQSFVCYVTFFISCSPRDLPARHATLKNSCKTKTTINFLACYFDLWSNKMDFKRNRHYSDVWLWK